MSKKIDTFRPYTAEQIDFKDRGKGIKAPHAQAAIEEAFEHKGEAERSIKIGKSTVAMGEGSVALGDNAFTYSEGGVAVGHNASSGSDRAISIGDWSQANAPDTIAIGSDSQANAPHAISIGHDSQANAPDTIAIGSDSQANYPGTIAIGKDSSSSAFDSIAIGTDAQGNADFGIAVGHSAMANREYGIALGHWAMANAKDGIALGQWAMANEEGAISLGHDSMANDKGAISIGAISEANGYASVAIGKESIAASDGSIAVGDNAATGSTWEYDFVNAIAIGYYANALGKSSIAFGANAEANFDYSVSIGPNGQPPTKPNQGVLGGPVDNPETTYEWNIPGNLEVGGKLRVMGDLIVPTPESDDDEDKVVTIRYLNQNPRQYQMIPSDVMILQDLEEDSREIILFKGFRIAFPGRYRIKFETKSVSGGGRTDVSFHLNDHQSFSEYSFPVTNNDNEWKSFARDLWFPPASLIVIQLRPGNQTGTVHIRNFQVCGSLAIASPQIIPLDPPDI